MLKKRLVSLLVGLVATVVLTGLVAKVPTYFELLEGKVFDAWFRMRGTLSDSGRIRIAAVDQEAIDRFGRWPWPRDLIARLTEAICERSPALVVFDITFSRSETTDEERLATDSLAQVASRCGKILFPYYFTREDRDNIVNVAPPPEEIARTAFDKFAIRGKGGAAQVIRAKDLIPSAPRLIADFRCGGHISKIIELDKSCRREAHVLYHGETYLPSMAVVAAERCDSLRAGKTRGVADSGVVVGNHFVPIDENGCGLLNYYGPPGTFSSISAARLLEGDADSQSLAGKIVVVGLTAKGLSEIYNTPFGERFSTVEKLATAIDNTLTNRWLKRRTVYGPAELLALAAVGLILSVLVALLSWRICLAVCALVSVGSLAASYWGFVHSLIWLKLGMLACLPWVIFGLVAAATYKMGTAAKAPKS